jgi:hypothetical protein
MNLFKTTNVFLAIVALLGLPSALYAEDSPAVDPEAERILRSMSDYLGSLDQFTFRAENTVDSVLNSGQKLQLGANLEISIQRPNQFRVNRKGDIVDQEIYFDGKVLTLFGKQVNYFATMTLSKTVDINTGLDIAREEVGVIAPASDIIYQDAFDGLIEDVESANYVGTSNVGGVDVHHLAFRASEVDWQIWIQKDGNPLPRKYLITSKWMAGAPQFTAVFSDWETSADLNNELFQFTPPDEATEIEFIRLQYEPASSN